MEIGNQQQEGMKVLLIGSGGCTALSLLSSAAVHEVYAVDINPAQIQLCKLKQHLIKYSPSQDFMVRFLGCHSGTADEDRLKMYDELKTKYIPAELPGRKEFFEYWDSRVQDIKAGLNRSGIYEGFFRELSSKFYERGIDIVNNPEEALSAANQSTWNNIFADVFELSRLAAAFGDNAVNFSKSQSFADHFSGVFRSAVAKFDAKQNYFLHSIWKDSYYFKETNKPAPNGVFFRDNVAHIFKELDTNSDGLIGIADVESRFNALGFSLSKKDLASVWSFFQKNLTDLLSLPDFLKSLYELHCTGKSKVQLSLEAEEALWELMGPSNLPPYLQQSVQQRLLKKYQDPSAKIHWHQGPLGQMISELGEKYGPFHIIQTSNITDWMPIQQCTDLMTTCYKYLADGGAVIARRLNGDYNLSEVVSQTLCVDTALQNKLHANDRSFFYSEIVIGWKYSNTDLQTFNQMLNPLDPIEKFSVATPTSEWLTVAEIVTLPSFESAVSFVEMVYNFKMHPYFVWMMGPAATKKQLLESLIPFAYAVEQWSQAVAAVISQMDRLESRMQIFDNLSEEHGHGTVLKAHKYTFYEFLEALGGSREDVPKECPVHISAFIQNLINFCKTHSAYAGGACLGIIESLYVGISEMISKVIFARDWVREGQQHHYDVHAELDVDHARELLNVARPGWNENSISLKKEIALGMLLAAQSFWQLYGNMFLTIAPVKQSSVNALKMSQNIRIQQEPLEVPAVANANDAKPSVPTTEVPSLNVTELGDPIQFGLKMLAADPSKLLLFLELSKNDMMPNIVLTTWFDRKLFNVIYDEEGWQIQQHKLTGLCRLVDPKNMRQAWGTKDAFKRSFTSLLQSNELLEDIKPKQALSIKVLRNQSDFDAFHTAVSSLEKGVKYPLGSDFFEIDHGSSYFAFFQRLGRVDYYAVLDHDNVVAVGCGVLRSIRVSSNKDPVQAWYLCDLKVTPKYRNQRISMYLITRALPKQYFVCSRGYLISMNPEGGPSQNKVVAMLKKFRWAPGSVGAQLNLYSLSTKEMKSFAPVLEKHRGKLSYLSLQGIKDIVLESTKKPMPLLHVQFGPCAEKGQYDEPQEGSVHMFCTPDKDPLAAACEDAGLKPTATATILQHRMDNWDWSFILTSDI